SMSFDQKDRYNTPINFLIGSGMRFKKFQYFSLTGGLSFCEDIKLKNGYKVGGIYLDNSFGRNYTQRTFSTGYFLGLNINF
ncbi:MAG: hypothetical protein ACK452_06840, partial [Bacteroidota bacterium]